MALKLDISKAYDRVEWAFLENVLMSTGFPPAWVDLIMGCVRTIYFQVLLNGVPTEIFYPHRGLRQMDSLSPYLFILCTKVFSTMITRAIEMWTLHGLKVCPKAPLISHLFLVDDNIIFTRSFFGGGNIFD